jgi:hypothetical protein
MGQAIFNDKLVKPNDDIIFSIIGNTELIWKQTFSYLFDKSNDISVDWKYSDCGKEWFCQALRKKKSLFWIKILEKNSFRIAFWFANRLEPIIMHSNLPVNLKTEFKNAKPFNNARCIYIDMHDSQDFENVKKLIDLKLKN